MHAYAWQIRNRMRYVSASGETSHRGYSFQTRTFYPATDHDDAEKEHDAHSTCRCVPRVRTCHARMGSVLVIAGWENMAREISDSGFMRARRAENINFDVSPFMREKGGDRERE